MFLLFHKKETSKYHSYTQNQNKKAEFAQINRGRFYVKQKMGKHILYALGGKPGKVWKFITVSLWLVRS